MAGTFEVSFGLGRHDPFLKWYFFFICLAYFVHFFWMDKQQEAPVFLLLAGHAFSVLFYEVRFLYPRHTQSWVRAGANAVNKIYFFRKLLV